jgi:hypothetical protein
MASTMAATIHGSPTPFFPWLAAEGLDEMAVMSGASIEVGMRWSKIHVEVAALVDLHLSMVA